MIAFILAALFAQADAAGAQHAQDQQDIVDQMSVEYGVDAYAVWQPCGFQNAFYMQGAHIVLFCLDNEDAWAQTAAHEMGHAVIDQRHLDPGPDSRAQERGADELGTLWLIEHDRLDDVAAGAAKYMRWAKEPHIDDGEHPRPIDRAHELLCLLAGSEPGGSAYCTGLYHAKKTYWDNQLKAHPAP